MPIHDWTQVNSGVCHDFHVAWIVHLSEALNQGLLPKEYYALIEEHGPRPFPELLAFPRAPERGHFDDPNEAYRALRRSLAIRRVPSDRLVALIELLSPSNKDLTSSVSDFVEKAHSALHHGCHLLVVELFPPGKYDPRGLHAAIWEMFDPEDYLPPAGKPLTLAAYVAATVPEAYIEPVTVGDALPDMPLFLEPGWYVNVPLEATYQTAYRGVPAYYRGVLEGR